MNKVLSIIVLFLLFSCQSENLDDCFTPTGKTIQTEFILAPFENIETNDDIHVNIYQSANYKAILNAGKNISHQITVESKNNELLIENRNVCNWVRSSSRNITLDVYCPNIKYIRYQGSGNLEFHSTFKPDTFLLDSWEGSGNIMLHLESNELALKSHSGTANIECSGVSDYMIIFNAGNGSIDASKTPSRRGLIFGHNTGWIKAHVDDKAKVELSGSGDIFLTGTPEIELIKTGSGRLITN